MIYQYLQSTGEYVGWRDDDQVVVPDPSLVERTEAPLSDQHTDVLNSFIDFATGALSLGIRPSYIAEQRAAAITAVQARLDTLAQSWGYDDILSGASYAISNVPRFLAEGTCMRDWRDATWVAVEANQDAPDMATLVAALPPIPDRPQV